MILDIHQRALLTNVKKADLAWRLARIDARARIKTLVDQENAEYLAQRDLQIRLALDGGVPKKVIGEQGLGTTAPVTVTVNESLARTESAQVPDASLLEPGSSISRGFVSDENEIDGTEGLAA